MTFNLDEFNQAELSNWMTFNLAEHSTGNILTYAKNDNNSINLNWIPGVEMCFNKPFTCLIGVCVHKLWPKMQSVRNEEG